MIRFNYITGEDDRWIYGKTWILHNSRSMEDWECEFITEWMQPK